jgi:hypothetical protein
MGKSYTYHILGEGTMNDEGEARCYTCMNKREMAQASYTADLLGMPIVAWTAQTGTGARWLGIPGNPWVPVKASSVKLPKLVDCPACGGKHFKDENGVLSWCPVCNGTGKTTKGFEKKWTPWQLEEMQKEHGLK